MKKKLSIILVVFVLLLNVLPVCAASDRGDNYSFDFSGTQKNADANQDQAVMFEDTITVTEDGGTFNVGFCKIIFPKGFLDSESLPATFNVKISSIDGVAGIEFSPDTPDFNSNVTIKVDRYKGLLYDESLGMNLYFKIKDQEISASHFSRYAFS